MGVGVVGWGCGGWVVGVGLWTVCQVSRRTFQAIRVCNMGVLVREMQCDGSSVAYPTL